MNVINDHEKKIRVSFKIRFFSTTNINILTFIKRNFRSTVQAIKYFNFYKNSVSMKLLLFYYQTRNIVLKKKHR